jgi:septum formation protein
LALRPLILASASPRRQEALRALGLPHEIVVSHAEDSLPPSPDPTDPTPAARAKAADVLSTHRHALVLAGDTIVALDGGAQGPRALGKPGTSERAAEMLRRLRGQRHAVHTAVVVQANDGLIGETCIAAPLTMREYSDHEIERYVESGEPLDCAGAYDVHKLGGALVESIEGCFSAIVGLPIAEACRLLSAAGQRLDADPVAVCAALYGRPCLAADPLTRSRCLAQ